MNNRHNDPEPEVVSELLTIIPEENIRSWESSMILEKNPIKSLRDAIGVVQSANVMKSKLNLLATALWFFAFWLVVSVIIWVRFVPGSFLWSLFRVLMCVGIYYTLALYIYRGQKQRLPGETEKAWASATLVKFLEDVSWLHPVISDRAASIEARKAAFSERASKGIIRTLMFSLVSAEKELDRVRLAKGRDVDAIKAAADLLIARSETLEMSLRAAKAFSLINEHRDFMLAKVNAEFNYQPVMS